MSYYECRHEVDLFIKCFALKTEIVVKINRSELNDFLVTVLDFFTAKLEIAIVEMF